MQGQSGVKKNFVHTHTHTHTHKQTQIRPEAMPPKNKNNKKRRQGNELGEYVDVDTLVDVFKNELLPEPDPVLVNKIGLFLDENANPFSVSVGGVTFDYIRVVRVMTFRLAKAAGSRA